MNELTKTPRKKPQNYADVYVHKEKPLKEYTLDERRAYEYRLIIESGTIRSVHTIELAKLFGVNPAAISRDRQALTEYLMESIQKHNILPEIIATKRWALKKARDAGNVKLANEITDSILKMLYDMGLVPKVSDPLVANQINLNVIDWAKVKNEYTKVIDQ